MTMRALVLAALSFFAFACSKPAPPTLSPKRASITSISPDGVAFDVILATTNPNDFDLTAGDVTAHFILDGNVDVGTATFPQTITLPANTTKDIDVPISLHWVDLLPLLEIAASNRPTVPYAVDGSLSLGGDLIHIQVPFRFTGTVSREQIVRATVRSIPGLPGLSVVPGSLVSPTAPLPPGKRPPSRSSR
jgi:LEA14-like dessication related protein